MVKADTGGIVGSGGLFGLVKDGQAPVRTLIPPLDRRIAVAHRLDKAMSFEWREGNCKIVSLPSGRESLPDHIADMLSALRVAQRQPPTERLPWLEHDVGVGDAKGVT